MEMKKVKTKKEEIKELLGLSGIAAFFASLCCVTPIVIVLLGIGSVSFAAGLGNILYFDYRWVFISMGIITLALAYVLYLRKKGICTLNEAKRKRQKILNQVILLLALAIVTYLIFNYVILEFIGYWLGIWDLPF